MTIICEYCQSPCEARMLKCPNCSAPINPNAAPATDYRHCPVCRRQLLALGSPACNYCGRRLPEEFIKARTGDLRRLGDLQGQPTDPHLAAQVGEMMRQTTHGHRRDASLADILLDDLTNLFS